jgi:ribulose-phosphate 3-epimerase
MSVIIPGILEQDWSEIQKKIELVRPFAKTIHIDLLDGKFADNHSFSDPEPFRQYATEIDFELHLMVEDPLQYVKPFAEAGFKRFLGHIEMMPNQSEFVAVAQQYGDVGLVLDAATSLDAVVVSYEDLDSLLVMTVKAGFSGQHFLPESLKKVRSLAKKHPFLMLEVDGGITTESLPKASKAGARRFVATSALFSAPDPKTAYHHLGEIVAVSHEETGSPE